jgi:uncharacterized membrane protein
MATENITLMRMARKSLQGRWGLAIGTFLIYTIILGSFGALRTAGLVSLLITGPLTLGVAMFSLSLARGKEARLEQIFDGFKFFTTALVTHLLMLLIIILWSLLLIIPGIIAALSYSMSFYILADHPSLTARQVLDRSKSMMYGYKLKLFGLFLRFLLLALLCVLTLGIGFLWLTPYVHVTTAVFYEDIKNGKNNLQ